VKTACPNCGGEVEFRYDDSFVRVCPFCRASVLRTDRGVETLGQFADLVPFDSPLALFAGGTLGHETFLLVGMAQLRQGTGGLSQEWYAKFDGRWGWLAEGQGRYYLTFEVPDAQQLPRFEELVPGEQMRLPHQPMPYTVGERGQATYMSATGELPFRLPAGQTYRFVDLSDGAGAFATIDYGDGSEPPALYEGRQVTLAELGISGGEVAPADKPISSTKITCPSCGAPVELRAPGQSLRVACAYCNALIDLESTAIKNFTKLNLKATPSIPLGAKGTFADGEMTVIGYLSRSANVDGAWYTFEEYLLHAPAVGFRWLVNSDGHWSYVQPIAPGAVEYAGSGAKYDGVKFKLFQDATNLRVDTVLGEMYWRVTVGEVVTGEDFIAPPAMLSREATGNEENWSLSSYLTVKQVQQAFGNKDLPIGQPIGVGANQPYGIHGFSFVSSIAFVALIVVAFVAAGMANHKVHYTHTVTVPKTAAAANAPVDPCTELQPLLEKVDACSEINYTDKTMFRMDIDMAKLEVSSTTSLPTKTCATLRDDMTKALHACDVKKQPVNVPIDTPPVANPCADFATYAQSLSACPKFSATAKAALKRNVDRTKPKVAAKPTTGEKAACKGGLDAAHGAAKKAGCKVDEPAPPTATPDSCADYDAAMTKLLACDKVAPNARDALRTTLEGGKPKPDVADRAKACTEAMARLKDIASGTGCSLGDTPSTTPTPPPATATEAPAEPAGSTFFSDPFELAGNQNIEVDVAAPSLNNDWVYFAADLVEDKTGQVISFDDNIEYYSGIDDGESWDEGSRSTDQVIPPVPAGKYVLRLESQHGGSGDQVLEVTVKQGIFRWRYFWLAVLVLGLPYFIFGLHEWSFEKHRWDNSSAGRSGAPKTFASLVLTIFGGVFIVIWAIISSMGSSDD